MLPYLYNGPLTPEGLKQENCLVLSERERRKSCLYAMTTDLVLAVRQVKANLSSYSLLAKLQDALYIIDTKYLKAFLSDVGTSHRENSGPKQKHGCVNELCYFLWLSHFSLLALLSLYLI